MSEAGYPTTRLEAEGIASPVVSVNCEYKHTTTYGDKIETGVALMQYTGLTLSLPYVMKNLRTGDIVAAV